MIYIPSTNAQAVNEWHSFDIPQSSFNYYQPTSTDWTNMNRVQQYVATPNTTGNVEFRNIRFVRPITPTISRRFYKGWLLNEVFDYLSVGGFSTSVTSYAKFSEHGEWYANNQATGGEFYKYRMEVILFCK